MFSSYLMAFFRNDVAEMHRQVAAAQGKAGIEDVLISAQSDTEAYHGRMAKALELSHQAEEIARRNGDAETAAGYRATAALREAEGGDRTASARDAAAALAISSNRYIQVVAALAFARDGDLTRAQSLADELQKNYPSDTLLNRYNLPAIRAAMELNRGNSARAIETLQTALPYELGGGEGIGNLHPTYLRGQAYLAAHQGPQAAAEFQKLVDHPGIVQNFILGSLAHLGLARTYVLSGDTAKARTKYQDFLALWKDADPDIPILKEAKAEYAKLQ